MTGETRSVLITGCSSGIGRDAALGLSARGWRVFATARRAADLEALRDAGVAAVEMDVACGESRANGLAEVLEATGGRLDALVNNAAFALPGAVEDLPVDGLRAVFETNLFGLHDLTRAALPVLRACEGRVVNISSVLGFVPLRWRGAYVASKYALEGLTDVLRLEMADSPVRVVLVQPGPITSRIRQNAIPHFERWIDWEASPRAAQYRERVRPRLYAKAGKDTFELPPAAVTRVIVRALEARSPKARYKVTVPTHVMGALVRLLPDAALDALLKRA